MRIRQSSFAVCVLFFLFSCLSLSIAQQSSPSQDNDNKTVEGTAVSVSRTTLVVRTDDNQFVLFTFRPNAFRGKSVTPGSRVRVTAWGSQR